MQQQKVFWEHNEFYAKKQKIIFVCGFNRYRSPTAQNIFSSYPLLDVKSDGIESSAIVPINLELLEWADIIFVMEIWHKRLRELIDVLRNIEDYDLYPYHLIDIIDQRLNIQEKGTINLGKKDEYTRISSG